MKKSKYTIFLVILSIVTLLLSTGCTGKEPMSSVDDTQPVIIEQPSEVVSEVVSEVPSEPESEPEPEVDPNEELTMQYLEVTKDCLVEYDTLGLKRDGKYYSLCYAVPVENWEKYGIGNRDGEYGISIAYGDNKDEEWIVEDDNFVIPRVSGKDEISWYGTQVSTLELVPMYLYGYTVPILQNRAGTHLTVVNERSFDSTDELIVIPNYKEKDKNVSLYDKEGNELFSEYRNLVHGDSYILEWNAGGSEYKEELIAYWCYYKPLEEADHVFLEGIKMDDGTVSFDFASVPSGIYFIKESYAFVEVKND